MNGFATMLCYLREREGLSQQELAEKLHMSRSAIGMYESGSRIPKLEVLEAFADFFNVDMDFLINRTESNEWSVRFRNFLATLLPAIDTSNSETAGIDLRRLQAIVDGTLPLSFDSACDIADELGESFDTLLGRNAINTEAPALQGLSKDEEILLQSFRQMDAQGQQSFLLLAQHYVPARADFQKAQALLSDPVKQGFHSESASQGR